MPDSSPLSEIEVIQNPALSAYALWRFGLGYQSEDSRAAILPLFFLVLPVVLHKPTLEIVTSTQRGSGLALFAAKLGQERENLLAVHERALELRPLSLQSIGMGINQRLLTLDSNAATLRANTPAAGAKKPAIPERIRSFTQAPEKLGYWFSLLSFQQVSSILSVDF